LSRLEQVHHINQNPADDHPDNLYVFSSAKEHLHYHALLRRSNNELVLASNLV